MSEREQRIRIAVVDDHEMFRAGVIATLQPHFDVVGQAADVEGSVAMIAPCAMTQSAMETGLGKRSRQSSARSRPVSACVARASTASPSGSA